MLASGNTVYDLDHGCDNDSNDIELRFLFVYDGQCDVKHWAHTP